MNKKIPPDDLHLWESHTKDVKKLPKKHRQIESPLPPKVRSPQPHVSKKILEKPFTSTPPQTLGRGELRRVQIDARLDLHGMTLDQAYAALERFLLGAQARGVRTVLVITGKGALSAETTLRSILPRWLKETPLRNLVSSLHHPAKPQDGGQGAFYVGLKRKLKR